MVGGAKEDGEITNPTQGREGKEEQRGAHTVERGRTSSVLEDEANQTCHPRRARRPLLRQESISRAGKALRGDKNQQSCNRSHNTEGNSNFFWRERERRTLRMREGGKEEEQKERERENLDS